MLSYMCERACPGMNLFSAVKAGKGRDWKPSGAGHGSDHGIIRKGNVMYQLLYTS